jgi:dipeptidyl aminopeptidase/acylaminoacyl peptidase
MTRPAIYVPAICGRACDTELCGYLWKGHGFQKREDQIDEITRMVDWFDKYLKGAGK